METLSIKSLAIKVIERNRSGNKVKLIVSGMETMQCAMESLESHYRIIYSPELDDCFLLVDSNTQAEALRSNGILDVVYSSSEITNLIGKTIEELRSIHLTKRVFGGAKVEADNIFD